MKTKVETKEATLDTPQTIQQAIKEVASKVSQTRDFDYRKIMNSDGVMDMDKLDCYFNEDFVAFIIKITTSDHGKYRTPSPVYAYTRKMKVRMITALLSNTMNPNSCFLQTFLGLHCYAHGP